jgi:CrcB protein
MGQYVWVYLGGGLGALARYALSTWIVGRAGAAFPWHTFLINATGSLVIGLLLTLLTESVAPVPRGGVPWRLHHVQQLHV